MIKEKECQFCKTFTITRGHHIIPLSKGGKEIVDTCENCESYIHSRWSHKELRDKYNTIESILLDEGFQKFLKWKNKQNSSVVFKSSKGRYRDKNKYH